MRFFMLVLGMLVCLTGYGQGYDPADFNLAPGEVLVAVDGVPVENYGQPSQQPQRRAQGPVRRLAGAARNIVGNLVRNGLPFSHTPGRTALEKANHERMLVGTGPLKPDPALQALALRKATIAAERTQKGHIGGTMGGAKCEGTATTNGMFLSCCLDEPGTYGGAAMVQGADGWYCCLLVR